MRKPEEIIDEWLVLRTQSGDAEALGQLVLRWQARLRKFAFGLLKDDSVADDVVQAAWMDVVKRLGSLRDPRAFRPWLFRITANKCADHIRRKVRERSVLSTFREDATRILDDGAMSPNKSVDEQFASLRKAIGRLDDQAANLLRWHYSEGLSIAEISYRLSVPVGTVKSRLYHIRQKLKESVTGEN